MTVSGAAPLMVDALRRVRRCISRRVFCRFCHARSRVPIVFGPFHDCASCERAAPDAPETIDDQRRCTRCRYRTCHAGSRGSASLPAPAKWLGPSTPTVYTNDSTLTERLSCQFFLERFLDRSDRLEKQRTDLRRHRRYMRDGTLGPSHFARSASLPVATIG